MNPHVFWLMVWTTMGACVGSFLNVVAYRLPLGLSLVKPNSFCPKCRHELAAGDNLPVIGWFILGGKCRYCSEPISFQYPLIEALTALAFGGLYALEYLTPWQPGFSAAASEARSAMAATWPVFVCHLFVLSTLIAATLTDLRGMIIPLSLPYAMLVAAILLLPLGGWLHADAVLPLANSRSAVLMAVGGCAGLALALSLLKFGVVANSFEGEDDAPLEDGAFPPLKNPQRVAGREALFVALPLAGMLIGLLLAHKLDFNPLLLPVWWRVVLGGALGFLVGGGVVWLTRIAGTMALGREAMGLGDVHLLAAAGAVIGAGPCLLVFFQWAPVLGLLAVLAMWSVGRYRRPPAPVAAAAPAAATETPSEAGSKSGSKSGSKTPPAIPAEGAPPAAAPAPEAAETPSGHLPPIPFGPCLAAGVVLVLALGRQKLDLFGILDNMREHFGHLLP